MKTNIHFLSYLAHFFWEWQIFQTNFVEKIKTDIGYTNAPQVHIILIFPLLFCYFFFFFFLSQLGDEVAADLATLC